MKTEYGKGVSFAVMFKPTRRSIGFVAPSSEPCLQGRGGSYAVGFEQPSDPFLSGAERIH